MGRHRHKSSRSEYKVTTGGHTKHGTYISMWGQKNWLKVSGYLGDKYQLKVSGYLGDKYQLKVSGYLGDKYQLKVSGYSEESTTN